MLFGIKVAVAALGAFCFVPGDCYGLAETRLLRLVGLQLAVFVQEEVDLLTLQRFALAAFASIRVVPLRAHNSI